THRRIAFEKISNRLSIPRSVVRLSGGGQIMSTQILVNQVSEPFISSNVPAGRISRKRVWSGRIISALPAIFLLSSGINVSMKASFVMEGFAHLGYPEQAALGIGITEFLCA